MTTNIRNKSAIPDSDNYVNPLVLHSFSKLCNKLKETYSTLPINEKYIAHHVFDFLHVMEKILGKNTAYNGVLKLPVCLFKDYNVEGSLHLILLMMFEFEAKHKYTIEEIKNEIANISSDSILSSSVEEKRELFIALVKDMEAQLIEKEFLRYPVVYLNPKTIPENIMKTLKDLVTLHKGRVVTDLDHSKEVTHIVDWDEEVDCGMMNKYVNTNSVSNTADTVEEEYVRTIDIRTDARIAASVAHAAEGAVNPSDSADMEVVDSVQGNGATCNEVNSNSIPLTDDMTRFNHNGYALVHWLYYPDSYDEWILTAEVDSSYPPDILPTAHRYAPSCCGNQAHPVGVCNTPGRALYPWRLNCRYVFDVRIYHEWGNEYDYELDLISGVSGNGLSYESTAAVLGIKMDPLHSDSSGATNATKSRIGKGNTPKRGRYNKGSSAATKGSSGGSKTDKEDLALSNILDNCTPVTGTIMADILPPTMDRDLAGNGTVLLKSDQQLQCEKAEQEELDAALKRLSSEAIADTASEASRKRKIGDVNEQTETATCQNASSNVDKIESLSDSCTYPTWFNPKSISAIEVRYLPEFFTGVGASTPPVSNSPTIMVQKSPASYLQTRNFIIDLSNRLSSSTGYDASSNSNSSNPTISTNYLSATDCRKLISGDACSVLRIHEFLDVFGIINKNVPIECKPLAYTLGNGVGIGSTSATTIGSSLVSSSMPLNPTLAGMNSTHPSITALNRTLELDKGNGGQARSGNVVWTKSMDNSLLQGIQSLQNKWSISMQLNSTTGGVNTTKEEHAQTNGSTPSSNAVDWNVVADIVVRNEAQKTGAEPIALNGQQCLERFLTMSIGEVPLCKDEMPTNTEKLSATSAVEECTKLLGVDTTSAIVSNTIQLVTQKLNDGYSSAAKEAYKNKYVGSLITQVESSHEATNQVHAAMQSAALCALQTAIVVEETKKQENDATGKLDIAAKRAELYDRLHYSMCDYFNCRMGAMEEKIKLIESMESLIDVEMRRQHLERRDIQIQRASLAISVTNLENSTIPNSASSGNLQ